jgi:hypothetical protein
MIRVNFLFRMYRKKHSPRLATEWDLQPEGLTFSVPSLELLLPCGCDPEVVLLTKKFLNLSLGKHLPTRSSQPRRVFLC